VGPETIRRAAAVHPICDLQIEYAPITRGIELRILPTVRELGIAITAYGVLSRGLLTGSQPSGAGDLRAHFPRFSGQNLDRNRRIVEELAAFATEKGANTAQLAIAWALAKGDDIIPVIGARKRTQLADAIAAVNLQLSREDAGRMELICDPERVAGTRYDAAQMRMLDSER
jgi:aryl-alcohol dehydrogenase-like predicted oxidoreductase